MENNHKEIWAEALRGTMWEFGLIGSQIERILDDAELTPLLGNIAELGQLVCALKCLPEDPYDMDKFDKRMKRLSSRKHPKYKPSECRSIEPQEFLYLAQLLIESYDNLCEETKVMINLFRQSKMDVTVANFETLTSVYEESIYKVLYEVDEDLAKIWKEHKWQVLGHIDRLLESLI